MHNRRHCVNNIDINTAGRCAVAEILGMGLGGHCSSHTTMGTGEVPQALAARSGTALGVPGTASKLAHSEQLALSSRGSGQTSCSAEPHHNQSSHLITLTARAGAPVLLLQLLLTAQQAGGPAGGAGSTLRELRNTPRMVVLPSIASAASGHPCRCTYSTAQDSALPLLPPSAGPATPRQPQTTTAALRVWPPATWCSRAVRPGGRSAVPEVEPAGATQWTSSGDHSSPAECCCFLPNNTPPSPLKCAHVHQNEAGQACQHEGCGSWHSP
jgi:hypothetical protein